MGSAINADWKTVCRAEDLQPDSGVCALIDGKQIAIFFLVKEQAVYAIQNYDPVGKANVLSRGIIGDINGDPVVASPLYKQHFNLITGDCIEDEKISVTCYPSRIQEGRVEIQVENVAAAQKEITDKVSV